MILCQSLIIGSEPPTDLQHFEDANPPNLVTLRPCNLVACPLGGAKLHEIRPKIYHRQLDQ